MEETWTTSEHCENYCQGVKSQQKLLKTAWEDLDLGSDLQARKLRSIAASAENVWTDSVKLVETQRAAAREQIDDAKSRIEKLMGELSDETFADSEVPPLRGCLAFVVYVYSDLLPLCNKVLFSAGLGLQGCDPARQVGSRPKGAADLATQTRSETAAV
jgi:hypothetical protein